MSHREDFVFIEYLVWILCAIGGGLTIIIICVGCVQTYEKYARRRRRDREIQAKIDAETELKEYIAATANLPIPESKNFVVFQNPSDINENSFMLGQKQAE